MGWTPHELQDILHIQAITESLLDGLEQIGFKYKRLDHYRFCPYPGTASWSSINDDAGFITIYLGCDPGAVAHEFGHGFHERLRDDKGLEDRFGEDYAEAIRWFVETRDNRTKWKGDFQSRNEKDDRILKACEFDWHGFVKMLQDGRYYPTQ